jgi:ATP-dependent DNA helicase RecQ
LKSRKAVFLTRQNAAAETAEKSSGAIECDEDLFAQLRDLRKRLADERNVPAYIVFSDVALRCMARDFPAGDSELRRIPGVGEKKLAEFGAAFLEVIRTYRQEHPAAKPLPPPAPVSAPARKVNDTAGETFSLLQKGKSVEEIAALRGLTPGTIYQHVVAAIESGRDLPRERFFSAEQEKEMEGAFHRFTPNNLTGVFESLAGRYSYGQLRIFRAFRARTG